MRVQLVVAMLVHKCASKDGSRGLPNKHGHTFYQSQITPIHLCSAVHDADFIVKNYG